MADLGTPGGAPGNSRATGVSGDGAVVIGQYSGNCTECGELPFRWTEKTGTQDLNTLLKSRRGAPRGHVAVLRKWNFERRAIHRG